MKEIAIHACRDANETKSWMKEKDRALLTDDGRDLASVQALQRKHEGLERELAALENKVGDLGEEARRLQARHPESADRIAAKQAEIVGLWEGIKRKVSQRGFFSCCLLNVVVVVVVITGIATWSQAARC